MRLQADIVGGWEIARPISGAPLAGVEIVDYRDRGGLGLDMCMLPQPAVSLSIVLDGEVRVGDSGRALGHGGIAGVGVTPTRLLGHHLHLLDIYLPPATAYSVFGGASAELAGAVAEADDVWGSTGKRLHSTLARARNAEERVDAVFSFLAARCHGRRSFDPEVEDSWRSIAASGGRARITDLAAATGWSRRRLWARFTAQVGVTPKRAAMIARLHRAIQSLAAGAAAADVAAACGYADQSHLTRDMKELAGCTPRALQSNWHELGYPQGTIAQDSAA